MNRRGFALLSVLWLTAALALVTAGALANARSGAQASRNRILLERETWAREACIVLLMGRWMLSNDDGPVESKIQPIAGLLDSVDLGRDTWCRIRWEDPGSRLNLNLADQAQLTTVLGSDSLVAALLDWRDPDQAERPHGAEASWYRRQRRIPPRDGDFASVNELGMVRGFDSTRVEQLQDLLTVEGHGVINLNAALPEVIRAALQLPDEVVMTIERRRASGHPVVSLDELIALSAPSIRPWLGAHYQELMQKVVFAPRELVIVAEGHVGSSFLNATARLTMVPLPERLALIRRESD
jgi:type II secretory pathway component PulK